MKADIIQTHFEEFRAAVDGAQRESFFAGAAALWTVFQRIMVEDTPQEECNTVFAAIDKEVQAFFMGIMAETAQMAAKKAGLNVEIEVVAERAPDTKHKVH